VPQSTFSTNTAADGAGIENEATGLLTLVQSTISANSAASAAGGTISNQNNAAGAVTILESIVAGNAAPGGDCLNCGAQAQFNLFDVSAANLQLGALAVNGGPTQTMVPLPGSPAIGAGSVALVTDSGLPQSMANDQRGAGFTRVVNGGVDLGALQSNSGPALSMMLASAGSSTAGEPLNVTANALAAGGNPAATFTDTVHFTSSDALAVLPADYTYVPADNGSHVFSLTLKTSGPQTLTVTDTDNVSVTASQTVVDAPASASASAIGVAAGSGQTAPVGTAFAAELQAKVSDAFGNGVPAIAVIFTAPASGASGRFASGASSVTVATDSNGIATAPAFSANSTLGQYSVTADAASLGSAQFALTNTGMPGYTVTASPAALTIVQGQSGSSVLAFTPVDGFVGTINLNCTGLPADAICVFVPAQAVLGGSSAAASVTLSVNTTGTNGQLSLARPRGIRELGGSGGAGRLFATLGILLATAMLAWSKHRTMNFAVKYFALLFVLSAGAGLAGCGVASSSAPSADAATGTAPGNYALSVSSTAGSGTQTTTVMITIVKE
jgi:hypothetical protein